MGKFDAKQHNNYSVIADKWSRARVGMIDVCYENDPFDNRRDIIMMSQMAVSEGGWSQSRMDVSGLVFKKPNITSR